MIVIAVLIAGYALWIQALRDRFYPRNWGVVEPGKFYRAGQISRHIIKGTLQENHIGTVIFMSGDKANRPDVQAEAAAAAELGITRLNLNLDGNGTGKVENYVQAVAAVVNSERHNIPVLVHCQTGAQRTGGVVAYYRTLVQGKPGSEAYAELLHYGHDPDKNPVMIPYLNEHMAEVAQRPG